MQKKERLKLQKYIFFETIILNIRLFFVLCWRLYSDKNELFLNMRVEMFKLTDNLQITRLVDIYLDTDKI